MGGTLGKLLDAPDVRDFQKQAEQLLELPDLCSWWGSSN